jgi:Amt family ammonium transporter
VTPVGALCIGFGVSGACYWTLNQRIKWNLDDTLDAFSVHGVGGIFGAVVTGLFATKSVNAAGNDGLFYGNPSQLGIQCLAVLATIIFTATVTFILLKVIDLMMGIRSSDEHQHEGLDLVEHGEKGYHELA